MSQVGVQSRPSTQASLTGRVPQIEHPLSRLGNPTNLDIQGYGNTSRGNSRLDFQRPASVVSQSGRPLANENIYGSPRRSVSGRSSRVSRHSEGQTRDPAVFNSIPEGVEVTAGDPCKTRLPVFGKYFFGCLY